MKGEGRTTQLPTASQVGASQYSLSEQSSCTVFHVQAFLMGFVPRPDGSGLPKNEPQPAAIAMNRATDPMRVQRLACSKPNAGQPASRELQRGRRFILGEIAVPKSAKTKIPAHHRQ